MECRILHKLGKHHAKKLTLGPRGHFQCLFQPSSIFLPQHSLSCGYGVFFDNETHVSEAPPPKWPLTNGDPCIWVKRGHPETWHSPAYPVPHLPCCPPQHSPEALLWLVFNRLTWHNSRELCFHLVVFELLLKLGRNEGLRFLFICICGTTKIQGDN